MNQKKIGELICQLRKEKNLTQVQLAEQLGVSDKAVSKWENGRGAPELSLLPELSNLFHIDMEKLLTGELETNAFTAGNMKKMQFYVCPTCGNFVSAARDTDISCCGRRLQPLQAKKATEEQKLHVEINDLEYLIDGNHPMTRDNYVSFLAFLTGDTMVLRKLYPEWDLQTRMPFFRHGSLLWYSTQDGLFYQFV